MQAGRVSTRDLERDAHHVSHFDPIDAASDLHRLAQVLQGHEHPNATSNNLVKSV